MTRIGEPVARVEDRRLLMGSACFVDDLHPVGLLHAAVVRSSLAHGLLRSVDTEDARAMPGVVAIYTAADVLAAFGGRMPRIPMRLAPLPELTRFEQAVIGWERIRYVGEPVAFVVAETAAQAEDAAERVFADIEPLPAVASWRAAAAGNCLLFPEAGGNAAITYTARKGDAAGVMGPYVRRERFAVQRHTALTMETRGLLASWDAQAQRLTVHGAAKVPFFIRRILASALELPVEAVDMVEVDVGGGFGVRGEFYPEDFLVPFAARALGRPVKWIEDRREHLMGTNHSREMEAELEIVCERNGRVLALRGSVNVDVGAHMRSSVSAPPRNVAQFISGPYDVPHVHMASTCWLTNKTPIGTYRGPGLYEADFFRERLFDIAAGELGIDPIEFRRINLVQPEAMPYSLAEVDGPRRTEQLDGGDYGAALDRCLREFGWKDKAALQGCEVDGVFHGLAVSSFIEGTAAGPKELARMELGEDGILTVCVGASNVGQGVCTVMAQIAADALGLDIADVRVRVGSTTLLPDGYGSFHSRATVMGGSAVLAAAKALRQSAVRLATAQFGCSEAEVTIEVGLEARAGERSLSRRELGRLGLAAVGEFASEKRTYGFGAAAAHVTVDAATGQVRVLDYLAVQDIGRIINPLTAHGQLIGAIVQGLGGVFLENLVYDEEGQLLVGTLADYLLPTAADFPNLRALLLEDSPSPSNPLGAKGVGEGGTIPVAGVVANAVAAALSSHKVAPNTLPLSPSRLWQMLQESPVKSRYNEGWA